MQFFRSVHRQAAAVANQCRAYAAFIIYFYKRHHHVQIVNFYFYPSSRTADSAATPNRPSAALQRHVVHLFDFCRQLHEGRWGRMSHRTRRVYRGLSQQRVHVHALLTRGNGRDSVAHFHDRDVYRDCSVLHPRHTCCVYHSCVCRNRVGSTLSMGVENTREQIAAPCDQYQSSRPQIHK